jgi:type III secretion protein T
MELGTLHDAIKTIMAILPRIASVFLIFPMFARAAVPGLVRGGLAVSLACIVYPHAAALIPAHPLSSFFWIALVAKETFIGLLIGFAVSIFFWVLQAVGELIDLQTGSSSAAVYDPISGHPQGPTGMLLHQLGITLFLAAGGLLMLAGLLYESYRVWPIFSFYPNIGAGLESFVVRETDSFWTATVKLGAAVILLLLLIDFGLGLINRFVPQLNVFMISMPIKAAAAVFTLTVFLSFIYDSLKMFLAPGGRIMKLLRGVLA